MKNYDIYGQESSDFKMLLIAIERALSIQFEVHQSYYRGGEYYKFVGDDGENFILQKNFNPIEAEWTERDFEEMGVILYVNETERSEKLENLLTEAIPEIKLLKRRQI